VVVKNILSIDVEDWFQVENYAHAIPPSTWAEKELRVRRNVELILDLLAAFGTKATFFTLGWIADRERDLVRRIAREGHEIASHGWSHTPIWCLSGDEFKKEIRRSRALLQDLSGQPVLGYRAPTFSVTEKTLWALGELAEAGYTFDSSIFPVWHDRYGIPDSPTGIHRRNGLWEIPPSVYRFGSLNLPVAGGGYFRLYPLGLTERAIRRLNASGQPAVVYVHPWEFDPTQPKVAGVGLTATIRHRVGLGRNLAKLSRLLQDFVFGSASEVLLATLAPSYDRAGKAA
jgi:polysaccharide deacetylase family protein (PEP-CTERM system associated)